MHGDGGWSDVLMRTEDKPIEALVCAPLCYVSLDEYMSVLQSMIVDLEREQIWGGGTPLLHHDQPLLWSF